MSLSTTTAHPFGEAITPAGLRERFAHCKLWEDRYRLLIQLSKQLPTLADALKTPDIELSGCENRVWLGSEQREDGTLHFYGDSEGRIVRGLLAILLTAVEGKSPQALVQEDPLRLFAELDLLSQLSASRSSGLQALAEAVQRAARAAQR